MSKSYTILDKFYSIIVCQVLFTQHWAILTQLFLECVNFVTNTVYLYSLHVTRLISSPSKIDRAYLSTMSVRPVSNVPLYIWKRLNWTQVSLNGKLLQMVQVFLNGPRLFKWSTCFKWIQVALKGSYFFEIFLNGI